MRSLRLKLHNLFLISLITLTSCSSAPKVMRFQMPEQPSSNSAVWPPPPKPARYAYLGDITGEQNFHSVAGESFKGFKKLVRIIVGAGGRHRVPDVLQRPQSGLTTDEGRIYVTDVSRKAIYAFDENQGTMEIWQLATRGTKFVSPIGIAEAGNGQIYVADSELGQIFILDSTGNPTGKFGADVLERPTGLAHDPVSGRLYVADTKANNIKVFSPDGKLLSVIGSTGETAGRLHSPTYLAFHNNELYVSDTLNAHIQVFGADGDYLRTIGKRGLFVGQFTRPKGVALDSENNIYAIESYFDHLIIFDHQGELLLTIGGPGKEAGKFYLPCGIWIDNRDRIFVADMMNGRIAVFQYLGASEKTGELPDLLTKSGNQDVP